LHFIREERKRAGPSNADPKSFWKKARQEWHQHQEATHQAEQAPALGGAQEEDGQAST
jgi:hypothetical protein